jgi:chromosome segregation ATPase
MAPELIIAAVSASSAVLLTVGGLVAGRGIGDMASRKKRMEMQATINALRDKLQEAITKADGARAEIEGLRVDMEARPAPSDRVETENLAQLEARLADTEAKLKKAESAADEADKEFSIVREKLDKTEKRLAEANRRVSELEDSAKSDDRAEALEVELADAKRLAVKLEVVEKERDHALRRIRELDKKPGEEARIRTVTEQLKASEAARAKLEQQLRELSAAKPEAGSDELEKLRAEVEAANERIAVSERVMDGVRARSNMLAQELKKTKAELDDLKGS